MTLGLRGAVILALSALALGVGLGFALRGFSVAAREEQPRAAPAQPERASGEVTARLSPADKHELRELIRQELSGAPGAAAPSPPAPETADEDPGEVAASPTELQAFDRARSLVDNGLRRGVWTDSDLASLRATLREVPAELQEDVVRPLVVAANRDQLKVTGKALY